MIDNISTEGTDVKNTTEGSLLYFISHGFIYFGLTFSSSHIRSGNSLMNDIGNCFNMFIVIGLLTSIIGYEEQCSLCCEMFQLDKYTQVDGYLMRSR